ncbi:MAG: diheme cytochrome c [Gammaproteobacteria bacterium SHHR-1]
MKMNKTLMIGTASLLVLGLSLTLADQLSADDDPEREGGIIQRWFGEGDKHGRQSAYLKDSDHARYQEECGSCHLAYPPGLMPGSAWQRVMGGLADHFGDNAELDEVSVLQLQAYLLRHSAEKSSAEYAERMARATQGQPTMMRITDTQYFIGKHHELSAEMVKDNPKVLSFSQCQACHSRADQGSFDEDEVSIPGFGRWED